MLSVFLREMSSSAPSSSIERWLRSLLRDVASTAKGPCLTMSSMPASAETLSKSCSGYVRDSSAPEFPPVGEQAARVRPRTDTAKRFIGFSQDQGRPTLALQLELKPGVC